MNMNTDTELCNDNDDDPGLIFKLAQPAQVHTCMAMPSVATIMPGSTADESVDNLYRWLDTLAVSLQQAVTGECTTI